MAGWQTKLILAASAALAVAACAAAPEPSDSAVARSREIPLRLTLREDVVGCYALYAHGRLLDSSYYNSAPSVELSAATFDSVQGLGGASRHLLPLDVDEAYRRRVAEADFGPSWSADSLSDSVRLSFVDGFSGTELVLAAPPEKPDTLRGRVFESWDFGPPFETTHGPAYAVRRPCRG